MTIDAIAALPIPYATLCDTLRVESEEDGATLLRVVGRTMRATPLEGGSLLHLALRYDTPHEVLATTLASDLGELLEGLGRVYIYPSVAKPDATSYDALIEEMGEGGEWVTLVDAASAPDMNDLLGSLAGGLGPDVLGQMGAMLQDPNAMAQFAKMAEGLMADPSMRAMVEKTAQDLQGGDQGDVLARAREMAEKTAAENPELLANLGIELPDESDDA